MSRQTNDGPAAGFSMNNHIPAPPSEISSGSETTSSPYIPTPLSTTSITDLPLPKIKQSHRVHQQQPQGQSSIHEPPGIPSTFLPSYYSESRIPHALHSSLSPFQANRIPNIPELDENLSRHNPSIWENMSRSGPHQFDLLEGITLPCSPSGAAFASSSRKTVTDTDENDMGGSGSGGYRRGTALMDFADKPTVTPVTIYNSWSVVDKSGNGTDNNNSSENNGGLPAWQPGPSSTSASQLTRSELGLSQKSTSASPYHSHAQTNPNPSPRYQPYQHQRIISNAASASQSPANMGSMLPPPNPNPNGVTMSMGRSWSEPTLPENTPHSAGYPGIMYTNVPLLEGYMSTPPFGGRAVDSVQVGPDEFSQAYEIYYHMLSAIPFITPSTQSQCQSQNQLELSPASKQIQMQSTPRQTFDSLIQLAAESHHLLTGSAAPMPSQFLGPNYGLQRGKRRNSDPDVGPGLNAIPPSGITPSDSEIPPSGSNKKSVPKCLGCGATETPEWRRGPMGPRTLCNACGLVHMKLQRKKKKAEEKARAAAATATSASAG
ncbi:hypothetical protein I203_101331 [Kwoniella mangroviensis CBS 8507]|uniref:uncharacterized protein n=1 Tax=Kwoniella mangroviensis CBS 8507 TaxID=1296122 RepID=UPI00080D5715|nr:uncharacterized protein I203_02970 [Kwoniella mangroviensis CBS 8507]OCF68303.1 hypothetical protein I203_02970 [Kwoniella mangroviensis CBS 8507]